MLLDEKIDRLARAMREAEVPHAFGGAIALAYYATPRGARHVDVNVFLPARSFDRVQAALVPLGVEPPTTRMRRTLQREDQIRIFWDTTPLDLFFSYNELHDACMERRRRVAFGAERIPILSLEDLSIFKVLFARDKDWRDLREMLLAQAGQLDTAYVFGWLERIVAEEDERLARFRELVAERGSAR